MSLILLLSVLTLSSGKLFNDYTTADLRDWLLDDCPGISKLTILKFNKNDIDGETFSILAEDNFKLLDDFYHFSIKTEEIHRLQLCYKKYEITNDKIQPTNDTNHETTNNNTSKDNSQESMSEYEYGLIDIEKQISDLKAKAAKLRQKEESVEEELEDRDIIFFDELDRSQIEEVAKDLKDDLDISLDESIVDEISELGEIEEELEEIESSQNDLQELELEIEEKQEENQEEVIKEHHHTHHHHHHSGEGDDKK